MARLGLAGERAAAERAMREAMPFPIVTVVVSRQAIQGWLASAAPAEVEEYERMVAAGVIRETDGVVR